MTPEQWTALALGCSALTFVLQKDTTMRVIALILLTSALALALS